jgi:hypothetical protein
MLAETGGNAPQKAEMLPQVLENKGKAEMLAETGGNAEMVAQAIEIIGGNQKAEMRKCSPYRGRRLPLRTAPPLAPGRKGADDLKNWAKYFSPRLYGNYVEAARINL